MSQFKILWALCSTLVFVTCVFLFPPSGLPDYIGVAVASAIVGLVATLALGQWSAR